MYTIALLACTKLKRNVAAEAGNMYTSVWFSKAKQYALRHCDDWYILSAEYYLVHHSTVIQPYNKTLNSMTSRERSAWADVVSQQLAQLHFDNLLVLAGKRYATAVPFGRYDVVFPLAGLGIGQQLAWFDRNM